MTIGDISDKDLDIARRAYGTHCAANKLIGALESIGLSIESGIGSGEKGDKPAGALYGILDAQAAILSRIFAIDLGDDDIARAFDETMEKGMKETPDEMRGDIVAKLLTLSGKGNAK